MTTLAPTAAEAAPQPAPKRNLLRGAAILIGEPLDTAAAATRASLRSEGADNVIWRRTMKGVKEALVKGGIDLALIDMTLPDGDAIDLTRRVRFGEFGDNPFLPLVITTWRAETTLISAALAAGADDVLAKPVSATAVARRVNRIATDRKPFVASGDYIGPVRADMAKEHAAARTFEAPSRLKALALGKSAYSPEQQEAFRKAQLRLTAARVDNCLRAVSAAARRALATKPEPLADPQTRHAIAVAAAGLLAIVDIVPEGNLRDAILRLGALARVAAKGEREAERAATLTAEICAAVATIITLRQNEELILPAEIIEKLESRCPALGVA